MIYGYARISRPTQSIERQKRNIKFKYPGAVIVEEAFTGTTTERPKWLRLVAAVKSGDTIIFDSVSRMSRDAEEGFAAYEELYNRDVELVFLKEPMIDTAAFRRALAAAVPLTGSNVDLILQGVNAFLLELAREQIKIAFAQAEGDRRQKIQYATRFSRQPEGEKLFAEDQDDPQRQREEKDENAVGEFHVIFELLQSVFRIELGQARSPQREKVSAQCHHDGRQDLRRRHQPHRARGEEHVRQQNVHSVGEQYAGIV